MKWHFLFNSSYTFLARKSPNLILGLATFLLLMIGWLDYLSGKDFQVDLFYLLPIFLVVWFTRTTWGIITTILAALIGAVINNVTGQFSTNSLIEIWNIFIELGFFLLFTGMLAVLKQHVEKLHQLAHEDELTGIANSRYFYNLVELEKSRSQRLNLTFSLVYLDIDNFKQVNDIMGHEVGDTLLRNVAMVLRQTIRKTDIPARLGGDEFSILFPETNLTEIKPIISRTRDNMMQLAASHGWSVTFSIGVVVFTQSPNSVQEMVTIVDKVMYSVKNNGKNNIAFQIWSNPFSEVI